MSKKYIYIIAAALLIVIQSNAQIKPEGSGKNGDADSKSASNESPEKNKPKIPSVIKAWEIHEQGSLIQKSEIDTALGFFQIYQPIYQNSISNTFTGNNGGAYISNNFFKRTYNSDFYFSRSFDAYWLAPSQIKYYNTTTPYSLLDYTQSENRSSKNETRFNVFFSQNVNKKLNFEIIYNQTRSTGQYLSQENKFHNIALVSSYNSNNFLSHSNIIFNRLEGQENGGLDTLANGQTQPIIGTEKTENFTVRMDDATNKLQNNTIFTTNEYRLGKTIAADTTENSVEIFIPRVGFIHEFEFSGNKRSFTKTDPTNFFKNIYSDSITTNDSTKYTRLTNIFQIKFYEAPDRKYTFGKRVYIGNDQLWYNFSSATGYFPKKQSNTFVGGAIFRNEGKFWQWQADGRIYLTGYRAGQTELNGYINKPLKIGNDTTSLRIEGSLKTLIPEYYDNYFYSNHFEWRNNFSNINEMTIRSSIHSQEFKTTVGVNYSLISNYIYNNTEALPTQAGSELLMLSAYLNKDFESDHWLIRTQLLVQKASNEKYIHLPTATGFISLNYRTLWSKVMYTQIGIDTRYNTAFHADAYDPATARFYLQNEQMIGNYPFIDLHVNLKLKRTRFFFILMNAASGIAGNNYFVAPDYPYYRRTFRIGLSWSFYD
ncbi:MAG TPA: putative porin [Prolixibacteraceae bacterium]|nr:putative porin [Prolixibacteraceae bacterium]